MSDASLIVGEIQDLAATVDRVADAIKSRPESRVEVNVPEATPPTVEVNVPEQRTPDVIVNVPAQPAPDVHVAPPNIEFSPEITVQSAKVPPPNAYIVEITDRDERGFIHRFTITPQVSGEEIA